jgi:hypothetical protein
VRVALTRAGQEGGFGLGLRDGREEEGRSGKDKGKGKQNRKQNRKQKETKGIDEALGKSDGDLLLIWMRKRMVI